MSVQPPCSAHAFMAIAIAGWLLTPGSGLPPKSRMLSSGRAAGTPREPVLLPLGDGAQEWRGEGGGASSKSMTLVLYYSSSILLI